MTLAAVTEKIPIETDKDGVIRVGNTRVTLETLISVFKGGSTAEEIVYQFPVLNLADVYAVITYYLRNRGSVENYLNNRIQPAEQIKRRNQENKNIVRGLLRRNSELNIIHIQDVGLSGKDDATVLRWAAQENRILLTHDVTKSQNTPMKG